MKEKNKGITLIALVITIIVMLILVAVTINMAINGGLFGNAGKAVGDTQNAIDKEQELATGRIKIGDKWYDSIDDYLAGKESSYQGGEIKFGEIATAEVGVGVATEITITGENLGTLSIKTAPESTVATATISGNKLTITGVAEGTTSMILEESHKKKTAEVKITVKPVIAADKTEVIVETGKTEEVTLSGIEEGEYIATATNGTGSVTTEINGNKLTITGETEGTASIVISATNAYNTIVITIEVKEPVKSLVGYYAWIGEGENRKLGIIYADLMFEKEGEWGTNGWGKYIIPTRQQEELNDYVVTEETANYQGFGEKSVIARITEGKENRFYVMALEDFDNGTTHTWYYNLKKTINEVYETSEQYKELGRGKTNTEYMLNHYGERRR